MRKTALLILALILTGCMSPVKAERNGYIHPMAGLELKAPYRFSEITLHNIGQAAEHHDIGWFVWWTYVDLPLTFVQETALLPFWLLGRAFRIIP